MVKPKIYEANKIKEDVKLIQGRAIPVIGDIFNIGPKEWRVVHPIKNNNGSFNWLNFLIGGWGNFWKLIFILFLIMIWIFGFWTINSDLKSIAENPCEYCSMNDKIKNDGLLSQKNLEILKEAELNLEEVDGGRF